MLVTLRDLNTTVSKLQEIKIILKLLVKLVAYENALDI